MNVKFACPHCKTRYLIPEGRLGSTVRCKKCLENFVPPRPRGAEAIPFVVAVEDDEDRPDRGGQLKALLVGGLLGAALLLVAAAAVGYWLMPSGETALVRADRSSNDSPSEPPPRPTLDVTSPATSTAKSDPIVPDVHRPRPTVRPRPGDGPKTPPKAAAQPALAADAAKAPPKTDAPPKAVEKAKAPEKAPDKPPEKPAPVPDLPYSPLVAAIQPPALAGDRETRPLPGAARDACVAGGGRYLVFAMARTKELAVFDVNAAKVVKELPVAEAGVFIAGGADLIVVYNPEAHTLERWSLPGFRKEPAVLCPIPAPVLGLALGSASDGPLLVAGGRDNNRGGAALRFLDPKTLREIKTIRPADDESRYGFRVERDSRLRASADGQLFTAWSADGSPGFQTLSLSGTGFKVAVETEAPGHLAPAPDGRFVYTGRGVALPSGRPVPATPGGVVMATLPAVHGNRFVGVQPGAKAGTATLTFLAAGHAEPLAVVPDVELPTWFDRPATDPLTADRRWFLIPAAKLLVALLPTNDRLILHRLDAAAAGVAGKSKLKVTSNPPPQFHRGETFTYRIAVASPGAPLTFSLEEAPEGMTVSADGVVSWTPPAGSSGVVKAVRVAIRAADGEVVRHEFRVAYTGRPRP